MRITIRDIRKMKDEGRPIVMLTAYDYTSAKLADEAGIPMILVGDSLGMVVLGYENTIPVTMDDMIHHIKAVVRGARRALVVGDMPFMSYHINPEQAMSNAARMIQEGGAQAVKLEGGRRMAPTVERLVANGIPVMGHIGLTPQSIHQLGGYRVQGRDLDAARALIDDALALQDAGAFSIVLETVPAPLARLITGRLSIPTIGIGAGPYCDGQVQVFHDLLGLFEDFVPRHAKRYAELAGTIRDAISRYKAEVESGEFPTMEHSFSMDEAVVAQLEAE